MNHDEFVGHVQHGARLSSRGDAETAIRATFETLADRLQPEGVAHIAAQLPPELALQLRGAGHLEHLKLHEFYARVAKREDKADVDAAKAAFHARAVMETLREAISPGAMQKLEQQLPAEFSDLLHSPAAR
jgi:uncharacterized protein (DUF2267 family)